MLNQTPKTSAEVETPKSEEGPAASSATSEPGIPDAPPELPPEEPFSGSGGASFFGEDPEKGKVHELVVGLIDMAAVFQAKAAGLDPKPYLTTSQERLLHAAAEEGYAKLYSMVDLGSPVIAGGMLLVSVMMKSLAIRRASRRKKPTVHVDDDAAE